MKELITAIIVLFAVAVIIFVIAFCKSAGTADDAANENRQLWQEIEDGNKPPEPIVKEFGE